MVMINAEVTDLCTCFDKQYILILRVDSDVSSLEENFMIKTIEKMI